MSTETTTKSYRLASGEGLADVWWKTGRVTVKTAGAETGNAFALLELDEPRGSAPPLHLHHNEDETFYILEGEVTVLADNERIDLAAGDCYFGARGIPHAYIVRSERARMLVTLSPPGLEQLFVDHGVPVTGAEPPADAVLPPMDELVPLFAAHGCEILGPPPSLADLS